MSVQTTFTVTWIVWYATWIAGVVWSGKTKVQLKTDISGPFRMLASLGMVMLFWPSGMGAAALKPLTQQLWTAPEWMEWSLYALLLGAFGFCWWARVHLGRLWSGFVTLKEDHHIVDTGPYALVRHPIYTGVIAAGAITALARASPGAMLGCILLGIGFAMVARTEEGFLKAQLGAEAYDAYSRRVPMLVPGFR
jgi:protein-S-isoprenylcysteine O-methyltransferase Ste14